MASQKELKEANYIHRGDEGEYIDGLGQCGLSPCDYSKMIRDDKIGKDYRYCMKFQMPVDEFDSCKYHSDEKIMGLVGQMANLLQEENNAKKRLKKSQSSPKNYLFPILLILCVGVLIYFVL